MRETIRSKSGRPLAISINSPSKVGWLIRSSTASRLGDDLQFDEPFYYIKRDLPGIDIGDITQRHAQPDAEQPLSWIPGSKIGKDLVK
jgi:hypothetical protein